MEKQKKSVGAIALVVLLLIVTIVSLVLATYAWAKYTSQTTGNATANVAKWNVTFAENKSQMFKTFSHVTPTTIAPGTNGQFDIEVVPGGTEVCFTYAINIDSFDFVDGSGNPIEAGTVLEATTANTAGIDGVTSNVTIEDLKSHILVSKDGTNYSPLGANLNINGEYHISGCSGTNSASHAYTIYWKWNYEADANEEAENKTRYDVVDTAAGRYAASNALKLKFNYTLTATQVQPQ